MNRWACGETMADHTPDIGTCLPRFGYAQRREDHPIEKVMKMAVVTEEVKIKKAE